MRDAWKLLLVAAATLLALGLLLGNARTIYEGSRDCGTAFTRSYSPQGAACNGALSDAKVLPWVLIGVGVACGFGALVVKRKAA
jgi:hypothetical protein